uniref:Uncharacterized protein n=1 Tax=Arion vulgaris TaxID=1028688 RepID=A0A0B7BH31_9EUPU
MALMLKISGFESSEKSLLISLACSIRRLIVEVGQLYDYDNQAATISKRMRVACLEK